jgi:MFS family permease
MFSLAAYLGIVNAFHIPARQAFIVDMVGREDLMNAIALNSSMVNGARVVGPAVAGLLVAAVGEGWCFLLNGISYLAVIAGLLLMKVPRGRRRDPSGPASVTRSKGSGLSRRPRPCARCFCCSDSSASPACPTRC